MRIYVNGSAVETTASNLAQLHSELKLPAMVAIAVDKTVIPRAEWESTLLSQDAELVIIKMAYGG